LHAGNGTIQMYFFARVVEDAEASPNATLVCGAVNY
jgi:hypothetical protein